MCSSDLIVETTQTESKQILSRIRDSPIKRKEADQDGATTRHRRRSRKTGFLQRLEPVDITNGNSGSSTLNARGEFVGLAFDGTIEGVVSDWMYDPAINRTIHVDSRFMLWTMEKVDGATRLLEEMGVK